MIKIESLIMIGTPEGMEAVATAAQSQAVNVWHFKTIPEAIDSVPDSQLIVLFEQWPDEYPPDHISRLLDAGPLTRLIVCQGPWCASVGRTRQTWPAAVCVDESRWLRRLKKEFTVLAGECEPLPWTAGLDEVFAFDYGSNSSEILS